MPGQELFQYEDEAGQVRCIGSADVNDYLHEAAGERFTAKDFRTWHGSVQALALPAARRHAAERRADGAREVARRLGNTAAVCRKAYIHPPVLELGAALADAAARQQLRGQPWASSPAPRCGLGLAERRLLALLQQRDRRAGG